MVFACNVPSHPIQGDNVTFAGCVPFKHAEEVERKMRSIVYNEVRVILSSREPLVRIGYPSHIANILNLPIDSKSHVINV